MADDKNLRVLLKRRPEGAPTIEDFSFDDVPVPEPRDGEVLLRTIYLSLDPYMRGRMSAAKSYAKPVEIGGVMEGQTVGEVIASRHAAFNPGDVALGGVGWQSHSIRRGEQLFKLDPQDAPISTALGALGMPGLTAYVGLADIGKPKAGETVVVSAASGAVGSVAGQIAKIQGARVVGIAGGAAKCRSVVDELGFDAAIDHRSAALRDEIAAACPNGIDVYFENVGGAVQRAVFPLLNDFARMIMCGMIAEYNDLVPQPGPNLMAVVRKRLTIQGFIVSDRFERIGEFRAKAVPWLQSGRLKYRETIIEGLRSAPQAFAGLFKGENFGKLLVRVAPDPTR